jgi:hypothetical protein
VEQSADTSNRPTPRKGESRVLPGERPDPSQVGQEAALPPVAAPPVSDWRAESEYMAPELAKSLLVPDADARLPLRLVPRNGRLVFMIDGHARIVSATHPSLAARAQHKRSQGGLGESGGITCRLATPGPARRTGTIQRDAPGVSSGP